MNVFLVFGIILSIKVQLASGFFGDIECKYLNSMDCTSVNVYFSAKQHRCTDSSVAAIRDKCKDKVSEEAMKSCIDSKCALYLEIRRTSAPKVRRKKVTEALKCMNDFSPVL